jgi:hypothetical protein
MEYSVTTSSAGSGVDPGLPLAYSLMISSAGFGVDPGLPIERSGTSSVMSNSFSEAAGLAAMGEYEGVDTRSRADPIPTLCGQGRGLKGRRTLAPPASQSD